LKAIAAAEESGWSEVNCPPMKWNELVGYELRSSAANERRSINL